MPLRLAWSQTRGLGHLVWRFLTVPPHKLGLQRGATPPDNQRGVRPSRQSCCQKRGVSAHFRVWTELHSPTHRVTLLKACKLTKGPEGTPQSDLGSLQQGRTPERLRPPVHACKIQKQKSASIPFTTSDHRAADTLFTNSLGALPQRLAVCPSDRVLLDGVCVRILCEADAGSNLITCVWRAKCEQRATLSCGISPRLQKLAEAEIL